MRTGTGVVLMSAGAEPAVVLGALLAMLALVFRVEVRLLRPAGGLRQRRFQGAIILS
jgi:hypothetical protein